MIIALRKIGVVGSVAEDNILKSVTVLALAISNSALLFIRERKNSSYKEKFLWALPNSVFFEGNSLKLSAKTSFLLSKRANSFRENVLYRLIFSAMLFFIRSISWFLRATA